MEFSKIYKKDKIKLNFSLENCRPNSTYRIEFSIIDSEESLTTEEIKNKIKDGKIYFSKSFLCEYDFTKIVCFKLNLKRWSESKFSNMSIKERYHLSLSSIVASKNSIFKTKARENTDNCETIIIEAENPNNVLVPKNLNNSNFFDYLKSGIQFNSFIVIDFSGGKEHTSDLYNNQFLQAIQGFRETIFEFVKTFKVYGYGASLRSNNEKGIDINNKYFNLNLEENAEITGFTNIKNKYDECLDKITFEEKGYLSPVFDNIKRDILDKYSLDTYNIVFLLVNNKPRDDDCQKCIDSIIEICYLPISFVTILVGDKSEDETKSIKYIFSNKGKSSKSVERIRNNTSFFTMKSCNFNNEILKNKCLRDIPEQLTDFYKKNKTSPEDIKTKNLDRIRESFRDFDIKYSLYEDENSAPSIGENRNANQQFKTQIISKNNNNLYNILNKEEKNETKNINIEKDDEKGYINKPGYENFNNNIKIKRDNPFKRNNLEDKNNIESENNNINIIKDNPFKRNKLEDKNNVESENNNINIKMNLPNPFKKKEIENKNNVEPENNNNIKMNLPNPFKMKEIENKNNIEPENSNNIKMNLPNPFKKKETAYKNNIEPENSNNIKMNIPNPFKKNAQENKIYEKNIFNILQENNNIKVDIKNLNSTDEKKYKNTPNPDDQNKYNKINFNPFKEHNKEYIKEDKKEEKIIEQNEIKMNNRNNIHNNDNNKNDNEKKYKNTPGEKDDNEKKYNTPGEKDDNEKKYINIIPGKDVNEKNYINIIPGETDNGNNNNINKNNYNFIDNPFKKKENGEKKYQNEIPRPNIIENKNILNPFRKNIINNERNKIDEEKKYINATPDKDSINNKININNPFQKKNSENKDDNFAKNEIKLNEKKEEDNHKEEFKIGSHFKKKFNKDFSKLSTLSSNSRHGEYDYSND